MLKPADPGPPPPERPIGELVHELIEDGKAYARAEIGLVKAIAAEKGKALILPAILFGLAVIFALAAITALAGAAVVGFVIARLLKTGMARDDEDDEG